ncbi:quinoprotein glucose dehydrogenase [Sinorhizobium fredii]|uniref:Quinoprotein glucose dehydrogenase n=2 Tax=Sinorhizobium TaxID=28105 RepID=A0A2L0H2C5_RHIFR|nr:quinoprotein glucose dehydrogenase [Sinorhizobium fredii]
MRRTICEGELSRNPRSFFVCRSVRPGGPKVPPYRSSIWEFEFMPIVLTALFFALIGLVLGAGGTRLVLLGGSPYYIITGLAFLLTALLLYRKSAAAIWVYTLMVLGSLTWAVWEVGLDWWQLGPRGGVIILLGLWLLTPWIRRPLGFISPSGEHYSAAAWPLALASLVAIGVALYSMTQDVHDIRGDLPADVAAGNPNLGGNVPAGEWHHYGRTLFGQRYSPLAQIHRENVATLKVAWQYQTGDVKLPEDIGETTYQVTPLKVKDTLYLCTPHNWAIAVDAATGRQKWKYDSNSGLNPDRQHQTCRGVTYWADPAAAAGSACAERVYLPTSDARLIALDAANGTVCTGFADQGVLHLEQGMRYNPAGYYYSTSPPVAVAGKLIVGGAVNDNYSTQEQSGVIRAFDIKTGALIWNWDSGNPDQTAPLPPGQFYTTNSPNSWSVSSVDEALGLIYVPLGNQVPDQLGMGRSEHVEKYSSSIVALDINTGAVRWVRQTVHHDLWDMDVPAQPALLDITREDGSVVPALVGPTKQGDIYVLDRRSGEPIIPVEEVPAPGGAIAEDFTAPTQPVSGLTFMPPPLQERDMWGITMFDQLACRIEFLSLKYEGRYTPPSLEGTLVYPGNFGTFNWGSVAVDPERQVMFGMPTYLAFTSRLVPREEIPPKGEGEKGSEQGLNRNEGAPYGVYMGPFLGPLRIPCQAPPWGYVAGADLRTGKIAYKHKNGTVYDMTPLPLPFRLGVPGIGGPIITKGGVAFLGATVDNFLRAYDVTTGDQLWEARLPAGGQATPMTYMVGDKQYLLMVAGGHGSVGTKPGDYVIAYTLP